MVNNVKLLKMHVKKKMEEKKICDEKIKKFKLQKKLKKLFFFK